LTLDDFDIGLRVEYVMGPNEPGVQDNIDYYIDIRLTQNTYTWIRDQTTKQPVQLKEKKRLQLEKCKSTRLGLENNVTDFLGL
jgi:hypothetical protein